LGMAFKKLRDMMFSKKMIPVLSVFLVGGILFAFKSSGYGNPPDKYQKIFQEVTEILEDAHFSPKKIDDAFSRDIFKKYLKALDEDKNMFLQSDIRELRKYETRIDDEMHGAPIQFFYAVEQIYQKRLREVSGTYKEFLQQPFSFNTDESFKTDAADRDYPENAAARKETWRKRTKFMVLERYADMLDQKEQNLKTEGYKIKPDAELEKDARTKVGSILERNFQRLNSRFTEEDRFNLLVNTITESMDPHTTFFPPLEKRSFDEQMSGRFFGIGASLRNEDGAIKVATLVPGMPALKSGDIQVGDQVLKVGQGKEEPVDVTGFEVEDAVKLIRGQKGTEVRLTVKKADGTVKVVSMIRDEIILDETYARSVVIEEDGRKVGYIYLPEFYADWERPNGARSAQDVAREIIKLREQKVDGIIMDLRYNGGGSLYDVVQIAGYFIPEGPIVQVKDREGNPTVLRDRDKSVLFGGPLAIMVNEFSASASEILAAAMQDYNRGVVVGSTSTYGKGTVQRNIGLDRATSLNGTGDSELGTLKLTLQKFYRINGGSTQLKGVTPNIVIPDQMEYLKYREKDNPDALPWDEIQRVGYNPHAPAYSLKSVEDASTERIRTNPSFNAIRESTILMEKASEKEYSLNLAKYRNEQKQMRQALKKLDDLGKDRKDLSISLLPQDLKKLETDKDKLERRQQWTKNLSKDIYLSETVNIIKDMIPVKGSYVLNK
jgi:carboxyl-terminal processing protease